MEISRCCLKRLPQHRALDKRSRTRGYSVCCVRRTSYFDEVKLKISLSNQLFAVSPSVLFYAAALILFPLPHFSFITCYNSKFLMFKCSHRVTQSWGQQFNKMSVIVSMCFTWVAVKIHRLTSSLMLFRFHQRKWSLILLHIERGPPKKRCKTKRSNR